MCGMEYLRLNPKEAIPSHPCQNLVLLSIPHLLATFFLLITTVHDHQSINTRSPSTPPASDYGYFIFL